MDKLTGADIKLILESLEYSRLKFQDYQGYPSKEFRIQKVEEFTKVIEKIKMIKGK